MRILIRSLCHSAVLAIAVATSTLQVLPAQAEVHPEPRELSSSGKENLFRLGKVWGFLKYHHPAVRQGCFDWDAELLEVLPDQVGLSGQESQQRLSEWVAGLSGRECDRAPESTGEIQSRVDPSWKQDSKLVGEELAETLGAIGGISGKDGLQWYVSKAPGVGNPVFVHEPAYEDLEELDWRYRLLALFRYWNIIEYWFPYRDRIGGNWDDVLREFVPRFFAAIDEETYVLELMALIAKVEDGHANLWSSLDKRPPAGDKNVAVLLRWVEDRPLVWRVFEDSTEPETDRDFDQLAFGDVILAVDEVPVDQLIEKWRPYYGASNESALLHQICRSLLRGENEIVDVTVDREGARLDLQLRRDTGPFDFVPSHDRDGETFQALDEDIAYLKLSTIEAKSVARYVESAAAYRGLIIDIRNYPSAFVVFALGRHLVSGPTPFARFTSIDLEYPGTHRWTGDPLELEPASPRFEGQLIVLVDEYSMSQSEYTAMAFRASPGALVVGSQTAGADGNISQIPLPGGERTTISGIGVFYPDKSPTQKIGIVPDIEALPTVAGIRAGRDEVLESAVRQILGDEAESSHVREISAIPHAIN